MALASRLKEADIFTVQRMGIFRHRSKKLGILGAVGTRVGDDDAGKSCLELKKDNVDVSMAEVQIGIMCCHIKVKELYYILFMKI